MKAFCKRGLCLSLVLLLCAALLPVTGASAETLEERQQAVVDVAWAYYDKGHSVQYDGTPMVDEIDRSNLGKSRSTNEVSPEYATPNETMFTVCSDFAHQVYWEAFRYQIIPGGTAGSCTTSTLMRFGTEEDSVPNNPISVYHWEKDKDTGVSTPESIDKLLPLCQPGDVITVIRKNKTGEIHGHTMLYVGDVFGDGTGYLLHSTGSRYSVGKKHDVREYRKGDTSIPIDERIGKSVLTDSGGGSINLSAAKKKLHGYDKNAIKMNIVRPLVSMSDSQYPITAATRYRMRHPRLAIDRTLNKTRFNSAYTGETVTMTLKLTNRSKQDYTVPVTEKAPVGAKIRTPFAGANLTGDTMTLDVALKAGEEKTLTAEYEITAKRGEKVVFDGGSVGDIPSNVIPIRVGGAKLNAEELSRLSNLASGDYDEILQKEKPTKSTLADVVYHRILGLNVQLPGYQTIATKFIKETKTETDKLTHVFLKPDEVAAEDLDAFRMLVPTLCYGSKLWLRYGSDRCSDPRDMHVEPGDVIVRSKDLADPAKSEQLIYLGGGKYLMLEKKNKLAIAEEPEFFKCMLTQVFYVLRPTLAYDDIHTASVSVELPAAKKLKFKDVKETDWFYSYVKALVEDGTVSGMTETEFAPNGTLTYGQALKLIALAVGEKEPAKSGSHWASGYLKLVKDKKWITKDVDPDGTITRLALCKIAAKAKKLTAQPESNPFRDTSDKDVLALYKAGVISGMSETEFKPDGLLTRAQISKIIVTLRDAATEQTVSKRSTTMEESD